MQDDTLLIQILSRILGSCVYTYTHVFICISNWYHQISTHSLSGFFDSFDMIHTHSPPIVLAHLLSISVHACIVQHSIAMWIRRLQLRLRDSEHGRSTSKLTWRILRLRWWSKRTKFGGKWLSITEITPFILNNHRCPFSDRPTCDFCRFIGREETKLCQCQDGFPEGTTSCKLDVGHFSLEYYTLW